VNLKVLVGEDLKTRVQLAAHSAPAAGIMPGVLMTNRFLFFL
jgi:hypothetical protein